LWGGVLVSNYLRFGKLLPVVAAVAMLLTACSSGGQGSGGTSGASGQTVKVGVLMPLTGSTAWGGKTTRVAAEMARDEINASGAAGTYKLDLVVADSQCDPRAAHDAAEKLITQDKVQILVGEWCSSATIAAVQVANDHKIPMVVNISTADDIAKNGGKYTFQSAMPNKAVNDREYKLLTEKFTFTKAAVMVENNDFGLTFRKNMLDLLQKNGKNVVVDIKQGRDDTNFYPAITKLQSEKPDVIVLSLSAGQAANFVKALAESGLTIPVVSDYPPPPYIFEKQVGAQAAKIGLVRGTFYLNNPNATPKQKEFVAKFEPKATQAAGEQHYTTHWDIVSYDAIYLVADALKRAGATDPDSFAKALNAAKMDLVLGHYEFDQDRTIKPEGMPFVFIKDVDGGKLEVLN
jgi:branched-chain amino acid transport system substrate-binding protein